MAKRIQPSTTQGQGGYDYGYNPPETGGGARRVKTGGFGPDAESIRQRGQSTFTQLRDRIAKADEEADREDDRRDASNAFDEGMANLYKIGQNLATPEFLKPYVESEDPVEHAVGFVASLPTGTVGAIPQGIAQGYEWLSGRGVTDDDRKAGEVELLDANQRAASAVNAGINLVGTAFGGSGSMLKGGYRAARTGIARLAGDVAEEGVQKTAQKALKDTANRFFSAGNLKHMAGEAAEEAGEEFIQSFADDARYGTSDEGSFGRALESAAWGAAGGAIMSGAGYGLNKLATKISGVGQAEDASDPAAGRADIEDTDARRLQYGDDGEKRYVTQAVQEAARNRVEGRNLNWPGSQSVTLMQANDKSMGINQSKVGADTFRDIWMAPDDGKSSRIIEDQLGMTHEEATQMFRSPDWEDRLISRFNEIRDGGGKVTAYWARNPATKGRQPVAVDIDEIFRGNGLMLHPMVMPLVGADVDGDKMFATFNNEATDHARYATSLLVDPETGDSTLGEDEWMRSGIATSLNRDTVDKVVRQVLLDQTRRSGGTAPQESSETAMDAAVEISDALAANDYQKLGHAIENFGDSAVRLGLDSDAAIQDLIVALATNEESSAMAGVKRIIDEYAPPKFEAAEVGRSAGQRRSGSTPRNYTNAQLLVDWNMLTFTLSNDKNSPFRQMGEQGYHGKAVPSYIALIDDISKRVVDITETEFNDTSKFTNFIVACLRELNRGSSVENAIAGKLNSYIVARTISRSGLATRRVGSWDDMEVVLRTFCEARTQAAKWASEASKMLTTRGWSDNADAIVMSEMPYRDGAVRDPEVMGEFLRLMGSQPGEAIFDTSRFPAAMKGMSLNEMMEYLDGKVYGRTVDSHVELKSTGNRFYQDVFDVMLAGRYRAKAKASNSIASMIEGISKSMAILEKWARDGVIDRRHLAEAGYLLNSVNYIVGANESLNIGVYDPQTFLRTRWGREIASGDRKRAIRSVISMSLTGQFQPMIDLYNAAENDFQRNYVIAKVNEMARISPLHQLIVTDLLSGDFRSEVLDLMTDLDYDYDSMMSQFSNRFDTENGRNDLLLMALTNKVSEFDMTDINARRRKARSSYDTGLKHSYDAAEAEVTVIEDMLRRGEVTDGMLVGCLEDLASNAIITMDNSALAAMICDAGGLSNKSLEKATIEHAAQFYGGGVQLITHGGISSETDMAINQPLSRMSVQQFSSNRVMLLGVLSGRIDHVTVYDPMVPGCPDITVTRDSIFRKYCGGEWKDGQTPTSNDWLNLLRSQPQLLTMLAPHSVQHSLSDGVVSNRSGMSQTVESYVNQYVRRYATKGADASYRAWEVEAKRRIRNEMRRVPGLPARIAQSIPRLKDKLNDPAAMRRDVDRVFDDIVNAIYDRVMMPSGTGAQDIEKIESAEKLSSIVDDLTLMIRSTKILTLGLDLNTSTRTALERTSRSILSDTAYISGMTSMIRQLSDGSGMPRVGFPRMDTDEYRNIVERATDDVEDMLGDLIPVYRVVMEFADVDAFNAVFTVSEEARNEVEKSINESDLTDEQKDMLRNSSGSVLNVITHLALDRSDASANVVTDSDLNPLVSNRTPDQMKADLKRKAREIWRDEYDPYPDDMDDRIDKAIDGRDSKAIGQRDAIKLDLDSRFLKNYLKRVDMSTGAKPNANMLRAMVESDAVDRELERVARKALSGWEEHVEGTYESDSNRNIHRMPTAHFVDPVTQAVVTKLNSTDVSASIVPARTGVNGSNYRTYAGFAVLPTQHVCDMAPHVFTASELAEIARMENPPFDIGSVHVVARRYGDPNWVYRKENQGKDWSLATFTPETIENICAGMYPPDRTFEVFVPSECDDGLCVAHQETPVGSDTKGYLSIPNIINRINQFAQEAMNIKMKKKVMSASVLGEDIPSSIANGNAVSIDSAPDGTVTTESISGMTDMFASARKRIGEHLTRWLTSDKMKGLGYGARQANQLSSVMVQGLKVTLSGGSGTVERVATRRSIGNAEAFRAWVEGVRAETGDDTLVPTMASEYIMTLDQLSMSSMSNVIRHYGEGLKREDVERYALEGMTDLSAIRPSSLDLDDVLSTVSPVGMAFDNAVAVSSSPSTAAALLDVMSGDSVHALTTSVGNRGLEPITQADERAIDRINSLYRPSSIGYGNYATTKIYKVFAPETPGAGYSSASSSDRAAIARMANEMSNELVDIDDGKFMSDGMAIAFDAHGAKRAISWARTHQQPFAIPEKIVDDNGLGSIAYTYFPMKKTIERNGEYITLNVYDPSRYEDYVGLMESSATSRLNPTPRKVMAVMPSTPGMMMADAGSILNSDTAGYIVTEHNTLESSTVDHFTAGGVHGPTRLANVMDVNEIVESMRAGDMSRVNLHYLRDTLGLSEPDIQATVDEFIRWSTDDDGTHSVKSTARPGDIVTMLVTSSPATGGKVFSPIVIDRAEINDDLTSVTVFKRGDDVTVSYNSRTSMNDGLRGDGRKRLYAHKIAIDGVSFKSMGTPVDPKDFRLIAGSDLPKLASPVGGINKEIDVVIDDGALHGRLFEKNEGIQLDTMWWYVHGDKRNSDGRSMNPIFSAFFQTDTDGTVHLSDDFMNVMAANPSLFDRGTLIDLFAGTGNIRRGGAWDRVANGSLPMSTDPETAKLIRFVVARCLQHGISPNHVFSNTNITEDMLNRMIPDENGVMSPGYEGKLPFSSPDIDYRMVFNLSRGDLLRIFNFIDARLCPAEVGETGGNTVFDEWGNTRVIMGTDPDTGAPITSAQRILWNPTHALGVTSQEGTPSTTAKRGAQQRASQSFDSGMLDSDTDFFVQWFAEILDRPDIIEAVRDTSRTFPNETDVARDIGFTDDPDYLNEVVASRFSSALQQKYERNLRDTGKVFDRPMPFQDIDGTVVTNPSELAHNQYVASSINRLNRVLRGNGDGRYEPVNIDQALVMYVCSSGQTINGNKTDTYPSIRQLTSFIDEMSDNIEKYGIPIRVRRTNVDDKGRYAVAMLPLRFAEELYASSPKIREHFASFGDFKDAMLKENEACVDAIETIKDKGKRKALLRLVDFLCLDWGIDPQGGHIYGDTYLRDMIDTDDMLLKAIGKYMFSPAQVKWFRERSKEQGDKIYNLARANDTRIKTRADFDLGRNGELLHYESRSYNGADKFLRSASEMSRFMAMLNPFIAGANILDRAVNQGFTNAAMTYCMNHGVGPFKSAFVPDQNKVKMGADGIEAEKVFDVIRYASYDGDEARVLSGIRNMDDIDSYLAERKSAMGSQKLFLIPRKAVDFVFEWAGGGNVMAKYQRRNWFNQFARIISSEDFNQGLNGEPNPLMQPVPGSDDTTLLELQWAQNPAKFLVQVFGNQNNPYHSAAVRALNFSRRGEACQQNILSAMYSGLAKRHPAVEFFTTTCVSRFFLYSTNMTGRVLQLVAPMSSINHVLVNMADKLDVSGRFNFGDLQMYTSFREALSVDAMRMAPGVLAILLASLTGLFTPPDDEDKMGNYDEWLIGGHRIGEDWMLQDILGLAGPLACFFTSCRNGNPRFDLIWNGFLDVCYNNPVIKASTSLEFLFDPEAAFLGDFEEDAARYEDAPGGRPDALTWLGGRMFAGGLSWVSQFVTPSIAREVCNSIEFQPYERAYRYVYATDARGQRQIDPETGMSMYQETTYLDAQMRRVARTNPVIGLMLDLATGTWINGNGTGYTAWEQPRTVYYDDAQVESMRMFSVNDENGNPLPADQQQEKIYMVLSMLMSYDDMDELAATGFYLDYDTKMMVGDTIHDVIQAMRDNYSQLNASGYFDYYYGGLSYDDGRARAEQLKSEYYDELAFWQDLYYDKLWSEPLKRNLVTYNRYNTTYAQDDDGNWYATGIYNSINPVYHNAPGSLYDAGGTAGYENDWRTVSAVTGQPMDQRALIPTEAGYVDTPDLESLGDDYNNGYSSSFPGWNYANSVDGDGYGYGGGGWGWRSYGGGRGGRGGGGGGYSPNLYSRLPSVNMPYASNMYAERLYDANYDYLRPNFETKGSREAYKRSDI